MDLNQQAQRVQKRANEALAKAHPRENLHAVIADIVDGWDYVEIGAPGMVRQIAITTRSR